MRKIAKRMVDALKPGETIWDGGVKGFGVRRQKGEARQYVVKYRLGGKQRWLTIGQHGSPWTVELARDRAKEILGEVVKAKHDSRQPDPATQRDRDRVAGTLAELAERFLAEHVKAKLKPRTVDEYKRLLDKVILPALGRCRVRDLARVDVAKLHHARRATPREANHALAVLSKMMNLAEKWGERADGSNPCRHVERYRERKRERFLSEAELARLGEALATAGESPYVIAAVRLLILTGARLSEILTLRWEHVDFERACLRLPDSKTGAKDIYLSPPALELLASLPRIEGNPYVIPGGSEGRHLVNLEKPWRRIRASAGLAGVRLHDLRHSFASFGAGGGLSLPMIGALLGHTQAATTQRYAHLASDPLRQASELIGKRIAAAMDGGKDANVAEFKR